MHDRAGGHPESPEDADALRNERLDRLTERLPAGARPAARWLRQPSSRWARIPAGAALTVGGVLGMLPVLGFWMLPVGLVLLSEDVPPLARASSRLLGWVERRRPQWFTAPPTTP